MFTTTVYAQQNSQSHQMLVDTAKQFLEQHYALEIDNSSNGKASLVVKPLDSRIKVKPCDQKVEAFWPYKPGNQRNITVGVRCPGTLRWKLFFQASMQVHKKVAVLNTAVSAGDVLESDMISMREIDTLTLRVKPIEDISTLTGMKFGKSLPAGTVLSKKQIEIPVTIKKGDFVEIISGNGAIQVRAQGHAMDDGYVNEMIKIRNSSSNKVLQATVVRTGYVQMVK